MADGGGYIGYDDPDLDDKIDHDGGHENDNEQEVHRTRPFHPEAASTPYHRGEEHEMKTMMQEQSGLPDTSYEETPLLSRSDSVSDLQQESFLTQKMKKAVDVIKTKFPKADFEKIKIRRGKGKNWGKIVAIGPKEGEYKVLKDDESGFTKSL